MPLDLAHLRILAQQAKPMTKSETEFYAACSPTTVLALLDTIEQLREVVASLTHGQTELHKQRGTAPICDWCGFNWPCVYKDAADALSQDEAR